MLDAKAVKCLVGMLRRDKLYSESMRKNCMAALYTLSHGSMRFLGLAREAKAVEVLSEIEKRGSERAREKAKRLLMIMRGGGGGRMVGWTGRGFWIRVRVLGSEGIWLKVILEFLLFT